MGQTDPDGDAILREKGIDMLPAILCNAREFAVSCFEWLQNRRRESWDLEGVDTGPHRKMVSAYKRVRDAAHDHNTDLRIAPTSLPCPAWGRCTRNAASFREHP